MEFLKHLEVEYESDMFRMCKHIPINDRISLSIQASSFHYCSPRKTIPLNEYTHFEMGLIKEGALTDDILGTLGDIPYREELEEYSCSGVFSFVPKELVNKIVMWSIVAEELNL